MRMNKNNYFKKIRQVYVLTKKYLPHNPYHNLNHAKSVFYAVNKLSKLEGISTNDRFILVTTALLHDIIFEIGAKDNEEKSAEFAKKYLSKLGYLDQQIQKIYNLILTTKMPTNPKNKLEKIICDADLDNVGRKDFFERGEELRQEFGVNDDKKWCEVQLNFLKNHFYYTTAARKLRNSGLKKNMNEVKKILRRYEKC